MVRTDKGMDIEEHVEMVIPGTTITLLEKSPGFTPHLPNEKIPEFIPAKTLESISESIPAKIPEPPKATDLVPEEIAAASPKKTQTGPVGATPVQVVEPTVEIGTFAPLHIPTSKRISRIIDLTPVPLQPTKELVQFFSPHYQLL